MSEVGVVISGIGGSFPQSSSVQDFGRNLLKNKSLPTPTNRWKYDKKYGINAVCGQAPFEYFDEMFFGITAKLAEQIEPLAKVAYRKSLEAIVDAGLNPHAMSGADVGVYSSSCVNEFEQLCTRAAIKTSTAYPIVGSARTMLANRISFFFNFKGPSYAEDDSWSAVHTQLERAALDIRSGRCEAAIIVASNIVRFAEASAQLKQLGFISEDNVTRSFDQNASGSVRSDCCVAFFLQPADQAKRCYATVLSAGAEFVGRASSVDMTLPNPRDMASFLTQLYRSNNIDPKQIAYLEADGGAHPIRDECELNAIDEALVKNAHRSEPLLVGSVKSNLGQTDAVSGFAAICKAVVAMETGIIPATINFRKANPRAVGLVDGRLRVVDKNTPLNMSPDSVVAVNTLGMSGTVGHTVLRANPRPPQPPMDPAQHLPRLITVSGRTEEGVQDVINKIKSSPFDINFYRLVQDVFSPNIRGYNYRSYIICPPKTDNLPPVTKAEKRTVWFMYSGMGSQWAGMGAGLMNIPVFAESIERMHAVLLERRGVDLKTIITETGPTAFDNILKNFVGIAAIQVALTNVLTAVGLQPDGIIGHSLGEQACAYADGCLTEEQTILAAWARGQASNEAELIKGSMAAIGLGYQDVLPRLPPTLDVACHNSSTSCTLSGPYEDVEQFVAELTRDGVFAKAVNVADTAYHSRYIQPVGPLLQKYLEEVILVPKRRTARWVSTSVPLEEQDTDQAKFCAAEYLVNNSCKPVLFEEGLRHIPDQSLVIEIAPHGLFQAILKRALPDSLHISLTQRGHEDPVRFLLDGIGKTTFGLAAPNVSVLYPDVDFPVPRGTGTLAPLITFHHDPSIYCDALKNLMNYSPQNLELHRGMRHLTVNNNRLLPFSEGLVLMWLDMAYKRSLSTTSAPVSLRNIQYNHWKALPLEGKETLHVSNMNGTSQVEIIDDDDSIVMYGLISPIDVEDRDVPCPLPQLTMDKEITFTVSGKELYQDLSARGLEYPSSLQNISNIKMDERDWLISVTHNGDWCCFLESLVQVYILRDIGVANCIRLPKAIRRLDIDPTKLPKAPTVVTLRLNIATGILAGGGIYAMGCSTTPCLSKSLVGTTPAVLQHVPFGETNFKTVDEFLRFVVSTGVGTKEVTLMELANGKQTTDLMKAFAESIHTSTGVQPDVVTLRTNGKEFPVEGKPVSFLVSGPSTLREASRALQKGSAMALLAWSTERLSKSTSWDSTLAILAEQRLGTEWISLVRRAAPCRPCDVTFVELGQLTAPPALLPTEKDTVLVWRGIDWGDVQTIVDQVDSRPYASRARMVFILDRAVPPFSMSDDLYAKQLSLGARVNVLSEDGSWGCWRTLPIPKPLSAVFTASTLDNVQIEFVGANPLDKGSLSGHIDFVGVEASGDRIMGIGQWRVDYCRPKLDPLLRWSVPKGWSARDAATVPFIYSAMYYALKAKAQACRGESILIQDGTSALGQAAIRVATQLGCSPIYVTVKDARHRRTLREIFPQLEPSHILLFGDGGARRGSFEYPLRVLTRDKGVRLIVSTLPHGELRASIRCLGLSGRLLHFNREDALAAKNIGLYVFNYCSFVHGFSGGVLFSGSERDRAIVAAAMREGLRDCVVQPIVGVDVFVTDTRNGLLTGVTEHLNVRKAVVQVQGICTNKNCELDPKKSYIVVGKNTSDVLLVAGRLSMLGARLIVAAVGPSPSLSLVQQRQRTLQRQHGTVLTVREVAAWDATVAANLVREAAGLAPVTAGVVIAKDGGDEAASSLLGSALDASLVLLAASNRSCSQLAALTARRNASGRGTVCLAAPLAEAVDHLADLLSGATAPVTVLDSKNSQQGTEEDFSAVLPRLPSALVEMGRAGARCSDRPFLMELASLGPHSRFPCENQPLFVLPPLGVLHSETEAEIASLAVKLFSPVFVVESAVQKSIEDTAAAVVEAILARQPHGPYNVLGWSLGTVMALAVQRQLESQGKRGKLFLVHGDVGAVRRWAAACPPLERIVQSAGRAVIEAQRGAEVGVRLLEAVAKHESDVRSAFAGGVHVIRKSILHPQSLDENESEIDVCTVSASNLGTSSLAKFINENSAHSQIAGNDDLRRSILGA